jgi:hypothetical protein
MPVLRNIGVVLLLVLLSACQRNETPKTPVARLDNQTLTMEEVLARLDTTQAPSAAHVQSYIQRWITDEMLYREALRRGLDRRPDVDSRLNDIRRQLLINTLLDQEIYTEATTRSSDDEVRRYYEEHQREFTLTRDVALVSFALFPERDIANSFRARVVRGAPWNEALADAEIADAVIAQVDSAYFTAQTLFPAELWRYAVSGLRGPSFPIRTDHGFYVLTVWKLQRQGERADLAYVEPEIRSRLTIERRRQMLDSLIQNLRSKHTVQVFVGSTEPERDNP